VNDSWCRQDQPLEHRIEFRPSQPTQALAAFEPLVPQASNLIGEVPNAPGVAENALGGIMAPQKLAEVRRLLTKQVMALPPAVLLPVP